MASNPMNKIVLKSTTKMSLNDRFSAYRENAALALSSSSVGAVRQRMQQMHQQNSKNWRIVQQMENRPSVIAALKIKKKSLKQRLGQIPRTNVKARLSLGSVRGGRPNGRNYRQTNVRGSRGRANFRRPMGRNRGGGGSGTMAGGRTSQMSYGAGSLHGGSQWSLASTAVRSRLGNGGSVRGVSPLGRKQRSRGGGGGSYGGGLRARGNWNNQNRRQGLQNFGRGSRGGNRGGGQQSQYRNFGGNQRQQQGGRGRGRFVRRGGAQNRNGQQQQQQRVPTRQALDNELDEYMSKTRGNLDMELESYMAQAHATD